MNFTIDEIIDQYSIDQNTIDFTIDENKEQNIKNVNLSFDGELQVIIQFDNNNNFLKILSPEDKILLENEDFIEKIRMSIARDYGYHKYEFAKKDIKDNQLNNDVDLSFIGSFKNPVYTFKAYLRVFDKVFFVERHLSYDYQFVIEYQFLPNFLNYLSNEEVNLIQTDENISNSLTYQNNTFYIAKI